MNNVRLLGQYADVETGLNYNYYRSTYDPSTGRYGEVDPIGMLGGLNLYSYVSGNPLSYVDPLGLETTVVCRSVEDRYAKALGAKHCFVVVWHWDNANSQCTGRKIIDRQYSLAGNPAPFKQDSKAPTFQSDRNTWNSGSGTNYDISPPPGQTVPGFDAAVTNKGDSYNSNNGYNATFGPNSNTATQQIIQGAGGTLPNIPGAYGQYYKK